MPDFLVSSHVPCAASPHQKMPQASIGLHGLAGNQVNRQELVIQAFDQHHPLREFGHSSGHWEHCTL